MYDCTCLSSSSPSINLLPLFLSDSSLISISSSPARFLLPNSFKYLFFHVRTLLSFTSRSENFCLKCRTVEATPYSAARFPILAFSSGVNCTYGPRPFTFTEASLVTLVSETAFFTASFAAMILEEGTNLAKGPLGLGKTGFFSLKYCSRDIMMAVKSNT